MAGEKRVRVGDLEMAYEEAGEGAPPLVLVHGFTGDRSDWDEVRAPLAEHTRVITPDQRGHGATGGHGRAADYTLEQLVADLGGFLDAVDAPYCHLLGHSMGGMVALRLALAEPRRVASLVLMDTAPGPMGVLPPELLDAACRTARTQGMEPIFRVLRAGAEESRAPASRAAEARQGEAAFWGRVERKILAMDPEGFATLYPLLGSHAPVTHRLGEIDCPTTVLVGDEDAAFLAPAETLAAGIPGARKLAIPDAAHSPQIENTDAWLEAMRAHLERAGAASNRRPC